MATKRPNNPLALAVLTLLYEAPMHPYQMSSTLKERAKEQSIKLNYGSLYAVVEALQKNGFVTAKETIKEGRRPERTIYAITDSGAQLLVEWLTELLRKPVKEYPQFEAALSLMAALPPDEVLALLQQRLASQESNFAHGKGLIKAALAAGMPRIFAIEHEYELALHKAELGFLRTLIADIKDDKLSGIHGWRRVHELRAQGLPFEDAWAQAAKEQGVDHSWVERVQDLH